LNWARYPNDVRDSGQGRGAFGCYLQWKFDLRLTAVRDAGQIRSQYKRVRPGERLAARLGFAAKRPLKGGTKWKTLDDASRGALPVRRGLIVSFYTPAATENVCPPLARTAVGPPVSLHLLISQ